MFLTVMQQLQPRQLLHGMAVLWPAAGQLEQEIFHIGTNPEEHVRPGKALAVRRAQAERVRRSSRRQQHLAAALLAQDALGNQLQRLNTGQHFRRCQHGLATGQQYNHG